MRWPKRRAQVEPDTVISLRLEQLARQATILSLDLQKVVKDFQAEEAARNGR
jgi:hypothetical protein